MSVSTAPSPTPRIGFIEQTGFFDLALWLGDATGAKTKLDLPSDIWIETHQDWLVVKRRSAWTVGGTAYPADTMLGISLSAFLAGDRNFTVVFEPGPRRALQGFFWSAGKLVLSILDELRPVYEVVTPSNAAVGHGAACPACRRSASSMSGASTSKRPRATVTCSSMRRTRSIPRR